MNELLSARERVELRELMKRWSDSVSGRARGVPKFKLSEDEAGWIWELRHRVSQENPGMSDLFVMLGEARNNCGVCGVHVDDKDHGPC